MTTTTATTIADQNDRFRQEGPSPALPGLVFTTAGIADLSPAVRAQIMDKVESFAAFTEDNDPHQEHDFGAFDLAGPGRVFWKMDYYADQNMDAGSEDPADPAQCFRVLTVMLAAEY